MWHWAKGCHSKTRDLGYNGRAFSTCKHTKDIERKSQPPWLCMAKTRHLKNTKKLHFPNYIFSLTDKVKQGNSTTKVQSWGSNVTPIQKSLCNNHQNTSGLPFRISARLHKLWMMHSRTALLYPSRPKCHQKKLWSSTLRLTSVCHQKLLWLLI